MVEEENISAVQRLRRILQAQGIKCDKRLWRSRQSISEVYNMGVEKVGENYRCNICGNEVTVTKSGGGVLVCCGQNMQKI